MTKRRPDASTARPTSVSLQETLVARLQAYSRATRWNRSQIVAEAVQIYTSLPPQLTRRIGELESVIGTKTVQDHVRQAIEEAVTELETQHAAERRQAFEELFEAVDAEIGTKWPAEVSDDELARWTREAIAEVRQTRRKSRRAE